MLSVKMFVGYIVNFEYFHIPLLEEFTHHEID